VDSSHFTVPYILTHLRAMNKQFLRAHHAHAPSRRGARWPLRRVCCGVWVGTHTLPQHTAASAFPDPQEPTAIHVSV